MLNYSLTPCHAGIELYGDYDSLRVLHVFLHKLIENSPYIEDSEGFITSFAYEVRKAYEGKRTTHPVGEPDPESAVIYSTKFLWPVMLLQTAMLRYAMSFITASKLDQAVMYQLEHVVESALYEASPSHAPIILKWTSSTVAGSGYAHVADKLDSRCIYFLQLKPQMRFRELAKIIFSLDWGYDSFSFAPREIDEMIPPSAFEECGQEWPNFVW